MQAFWCSAFLSGMGGRSVMLLHGGRRVCAARCSCSCTSTMGGAMGFDGRWSIFERMGLSWMEVEGWLAGGPLLQRLLTVPPPPSARPNPAPPYKVYKYIRMIPLAEGFGATRGSRASGGVFACLAGSRACLGGLLVGLLGFFNLWVKSKASFYSSLDLRRTS